MSRLVTDEAVIKAINLHTTDTPDGLVLNDDITFILESVPTANVKTMVDIEKIKAHLKKDADQLIENGKHHASEVRNNGNMVAWGLKVAIDIIDAEVPEVGHWEVLEDCSNAGVYCSICHKKVYKEQYANVKALSPYCPNCGNKMEGKRVY